MYGQTRIKFTEIINCLLET